MATVTDSLTGRRYIVEERYTGHCPPHTVPSMGTVCGTCVALALAITGAVELGIYFGGNNDSLKTDTTLIIGSVCAVSSVLCCAAVATLYCKAIGCCSNNG